jgi:hypothetical protein
VISTQVWEDADIEIAHIFHNFPGECDILLRW